MCFVYSVLFAVWCVFCGGVYCVLLFVGFVLRIVVYVCLFFRSCALDLLFIIICCLMFIVVSYFLCVVYSLFSRRVYYCLFVFPCCADLVLVYCLLRCVVCY